MMHEISLCKNLIAIIEQEAKARNAVRIKKIYLEIGDLAAVEKMAMQFGFEVLSKGTLAEGAILKIIDVPGQALCQSCNKSVKIIKRYYACELCGGSFLTITSGKELRVKAIEVE